MFALALVLFLKFGLSQPHHSNKSLSRIKQAFCNNLKECLSMTMAVINPRFITNLPEFHDRTVGKVDKFKSQANIALEQIQTDMNYKRKEAELERLIDGHHLRLRHQKLEEINAKIRHLNQNKSNQKVIT